MNNAIYMYLGQFGFFFSTHRRVVENEITVFTVNLQTGAFEGDHAVWYAIDAASRKFAVSLPGNDVTASSCFHPALCIYAGGAGEIKAGGEKKGTRGGGGERRTSGTGQVRDNERAADDAGLIVSRNT